MAQNSSKGYLTVMFLVVVALIVGSFYLSSVDKIEDAQGIGGEIVFVEGAVEYREDGGEWMRASAGQDLEEGDSVEVLDSGRVIINLDDGSVLRLNANSMATLTSLDPEHMIISNDGGELYSRVVKSDRIFEIIAGDITYESLGTSYKTIMTDKKNGVEVYESKVKVKHKGWEAVVKEGEKFIQVTYDSGAENMVEDLTDEDRADEFTVWNKEKDSEHVLEDALKDLDEDHNSSDSDSDSDLDEDSDFDSGHDSDSDDDRDYDSDDDHDSV